MVVYNGKEFNKLNETSNYYKILNDDLKTKEGVQLSLGLNLNKARREKNIETIIRVPGVNFLSSPLVFMEGEYVLDFLGLHESLANPTVFSVTIPDDATVFVEDDDTDSVGGGCYIDRDYYPVKYITDRLVVNYRLSDADFLYLFKTEGWIYTYYKKQEDAICRFLVRSGFYETLCYVRSGEAIIYNIPEKKKKRPIVYNWNVSVSQEAARKGNIQLLEEICSSTKDYGDLKKGRPVDVYTLEVYRRECKTRNIEGEEIIKKLIDM